MVRKLVLSAVLRGITCTLSLAAPGDPSLMETSKTILRWDAAFKPCTSSDPSRRVSELLRAATQTKTFSYTDQLTNYLKNNFILHEPGRFLIIPKPYGVSCVGEPQKEGGVFENSVYNREDSDVIPMKKLADRSVTISECIPGLARVFNELGEYVYYRWGMLEANNAAIKVENLKMVLHSS